MTDTKKKANWPPEQVAILITEFSNVGTYEEAKKLAVDLAFETLAPKTERAIIGKVSHLSRSGVLAEPTNPEMMHRQGQPLYTQKVYKTKSNTDVVRKSTMVSAIADILINAGKLTDSSVVDSLESCTKATLEIILDGLTIPEQEVKVEE